MARIATGLAASRSGPAEETTGSLGWQVKLADLHHKIYHNVFMAIAGCDARITMQIGWLDPGKFAKIALNTERVVKIDNFYCVFQVTDSHFIAAGTALSRSSDAGRALHQYDAAQRNADQTGEGALVMSIAGQIAVEEPAAGDSLDHAGRGLSRQE